MPWRKTEPMEERMEFCLKALRSGNFRRLCREYGISAKTGYKWRERFLRQGTEGLREESRRPQSHPESLSEEEVCRIIRLKAGSSGLGTAQDSGAILSPIGACRQREQL